MSSLSVDEVPSFNWYFKQTNKDNFINDAHGHDHDRDDRGVYDVCGDDDRGGHDVIADYWWWLSWSSLACEGDVREKIQQPWAIH